MVFTTGIAMQTAAKNLPLLTVGRFFGGLGVGGNSCVIPIYLAEWFVHVSNQNSCASDEFIYQVPPRSVAEPSSPHINGLSPLVCSLPPL
jgi:hypothetical protein